MEVSDRSADPSTQMASSVSKNTCQEHPSALGLSIFIFKQPSELRHFQLNLVERQLRVVQHFVESDKPKTHSRDHVARLELRAQCIQPNAELAMSGPHSSRGCRPARVAISRRCRLSTNLFTCLSGDTAALPCTTSWGGQRQSKSVVKFRVQGLGCVSIETGVQALS